MADASRRTSDDSARRQQQSRLQRRRPASLQISPVSTWNVAIPLLSPLASSPKSIEQAMMEMKKSSSSSSRADSRQEQRVESEKPVFKKWQHPAAPFCYETPSFKPSFFVPV
ncbi:hypothetical protein Ddye_022429 [Dipteronia dyeriana]|uniref:Uncharacterized protein n=1 Tax=Dipteronia dyeriana TaxID=168575 RepID=A0AAD9WX80_9ROSI|nr:hypothetical protein Ddye_022429 [Dipteronia dyeriana]